MVKTWQENYGADADGNRGMWCTFAEFYSDISKRSLDDEDLYETHDGLLCSKEEFIKYEGITEVTDPDTIKGQTCCQCEDELDPDCCVYMLGGQLYCEDCIEYLIEESHVDPQDLIDEETSGEEDYD